MATTASDRNVGTLGAVPAPPPRAGSFIEPSTDAGSNGGSGRAFSRSNSASSTGSITRSLSFTRTRKFVRGDSMTLTDARHIVESSINSYAGSLKFHAVQMILMEHFPTGDAEKPDPPSMPANNLVRAGLKEPGAMPERLKPAITYIEREPTPPPSPKKPEPKKPTQDERFGAFNISAPAATNVKEAATKAKDATFKDKSSAAVGDTITKVASKKKISSTESDDQEDEGEKQTARNNTTDRNVESSPFFKAAQGVGRPGFRRMLSRNRSLRKVTEDADDNNNTKNDGEKDTRDKESSQGAGLRRTTSQKKYPDRASLGVKPSPAVPGAPSPRVSLPTFGRKNSPATHGDSSNGTPGFFSKMSRPRADSTAGDSVDADENTATMPKGGMARSVRKVIASFRTPRARTFLGKLRNKNNGNTANGNNSGDKKDSKENNDRMTMFEDRPEANPRQANTGDEPTNAQRRKMMPRVQSGGSLFRDTGSKIRKLTRSASAASMGSSFRMKEEAKEAGSTVPADKSKAAATETAKKKKDVPATENTDDESVPKKKVSRKSTKNIGTKTKKEKREDSKDTGIAEKKDSTPEEGNTTATASKKEKEVTKTSKKVAEEINKAPKKASEEISKASKKLAVEATKSPKKAVEESKKDTEEITAAPKKGTEEIAKEPKKATEEISKTPKKTVDAVSAAPRKIAKEVSKAPKKAAEEATKAPKKATEEAAEAPKKATEDIAKTSKKATEGLKKEPKKKVARVIRKAPEKTPEEIAKASKKVTEAKKATEEAAKAPKKAVEEVTTASKKVSADSATITPKKIVKEIRKASEKTAEKEVIKTPRKITDELRKTRVAAADEGRKTFTKLPEKTKPASAKVLAEAVKAEKKKAITKEIEAPKEKEASKDAVAPKKETPAKELLIVPEKKKSDTQAVRSSSRVAELRKSFMKKPRESERKVPKMPEVPKTSVRKPSKKDIEARKATIAVEAAVAEKEENKLVDIVKKDINVDKIVESEKEVRPVEAAKKAPVEAKPVKKKSSESSLKAAASPKKESVSMSEIKVSKPAQRTLTTTSDKDEIISKIISQTEAPLEVRATSELKQGLAASESRKVRMPGSGREAFLFDLPVEEVGSGTVRKSKSRAKKSKSRRGGFGRTRKSKSKKEKKQETADVTTSTPKGTTTPTISPVAVQ